MSQTDRSKVKRERARTLSEDRSPVSSLTALIVLTARSWRIMTPLGAPVEPEVWMT